MNIASQEGQGTTVHFYLPTATGWDRAPANDSGDDRQRPAIQPGKVHILLVEDQPQLNKILHEHLAQQGFEVRACLNGDAAWAAVDAGYRADIVLSDVVMSGAIAGRRPRLCSA